MEMIKRVILTILVCSLINISWILSVKAATVVVFPFENFSYHDFGVDFEIADAVADAIKDKGIKVIYPKKVIPILVKFKSMDVTLLNFSILREVYKIFNSKYVLIGSIGEETKNNPVKVSVVLKLIEVGSGKVVWGDVINFSSAKFSTILGSSKVSFKEIKEELKDVVKRDFYLPTFKKEVIKPTLDVQEVIFSSRYVKSSKEIKCLISLYFSGKKPDVLEVSPYKNKKVVKLIPYKRKNTFLAKWIAPSKQGAYSVYLVAKWKTPWNIEKRIFLGKYYVDNLPPKIFLYFKGAKREKGKLFVKDLLEIFPKVVEEKTGGFNISRGIAKWKLEVYCYAFKKIVFTQEAPGEVPKFLVWNPNFQRIELPQGKYLIKLIVWDLAGNKGEAQKIVYLVKNPPIPEVAIYKGKKPFVKIELKKEYLPFIFVNIEVFNNKGKKIAQVFKEGAGFSKIEKKFFIKKEDFIPPFYYSAFIEDIFKNVRIIKKEEVPIKKEITQPGYNIWVPEF